MAKASTEQMNLKENPPRKVLIINTFGIGDVLFTTPIISNLKLQFPKVEIHYLANRRTSDFLKDNQKISRVLTYERDDFLAIYKKSKLKYWLEWKKLFDDLKKEDYDVVIDLSLQPGFSFLCFALGIKTRIGFNYKNRSLYLNHKIPLVGYENKHVVDYYLEILERLGVEIVDRRLELSPTPQDEVWADQFLQHQKIPQGKILVGLVPGGGASWGKDARFKRWPSERYAKLADKIVEKSDCLIILMGDQKEEDLCREIAEKMVHDSRLACGKTSIGQFAALLSRCRITILNDGGPLHIAVAAGALTVSIFGPVDDLVYGPYPRGQHQVVTKEDLSCRPCYRRFRKSDCQHLSCLNDIRVEDVLRKVEQAL